LWHAISGDVSERAATALPAIRRGAARRRGGGGATWTEGVACDTHMLARVVPASSCSFNFS